MKKRFSRLNTKYAILPFIMMVIFFVICILLVVFDDNIGRKICTIILTLIIFSMFYLICYIFKHLHFMMKYLKQII